MLSPTPLLGTPMTLSKAKGWVKFKYLERIVLEKNKVVYREKIAEDLGRPRDVKESKDGYIYVSIENKGIYKIVPKL